MFLEGKGFQRPTGITIPLSNSYRSVCCHVLTCSMDSPELMLPSHRTMPRTHTFHCMRMGLSVRALGCKLWYPFHLVYPEKEFLKRYLVIQRISKRVKMLGLEATLPGARLKLYHGDLSRKDPTAQHRHHKHGKRRPQNFPTMTSRELFASATTFTKNGFHA